MQMWITRVWNQAFCLAFLHKKVIIGIFVVRLWSYETSVCTIIIGSAADMVL